MAHVKPCSAVFMLIHGRAHACSSPACCLISSSLFSTACHAVNICIHIDFILLLLCCPHVVVVVQAVLMSLLLLCPSYIYIVFSVSSAVSMLCTYGKWIWTYSDVRLGMILLINLFPKLFVWLEYTLWKAATLCLMAMQPSNLSLKLSNY